jgi:hypothetical protein
LFLKEFPNSWELELKASQEDNDDDDEDNDEDNEDNEAAADGGSAKSKPTTTPTSVAYQEFLQFLQLGCSGSPVQGYPTVVVVLSTIPSTVSLSHLLVACSN